jgi:hypothetical protein
MTENLTITHLYDRQTPRLRLRLERNSKGYNWEISYEADDPEEALAMIRQVNERMQEEFGAGE